MLKHLCRNNPSFICNYFSMHAKVQWELQQLKHINVNVHSLKWLPTDTNLLVKQGKSNRFQAAKQNHCLAGWLCGQMGKLHETSMRWGSHVKHNLMSGFNFDVKWASQGERQKDISPVAIPVGCQTDIKEVLRKAWCLCMWSLFDLISESKVNLAEKGNTQTPTRATTPQRNGQEEISIQMEAKARKLFMWMKAGSHSRISAGCSQDLTLALFQTNTTKRASFHLSARHHCPTA